jgi:hypothetical protein
MNLQDILGGLITFARGVYLLWTLVRAEDF